MSKSGNHCTGTNWDNFDVKVETLSGHGTVHHTYGITYHNVEIVNSRPLIH